MKDRRHLGIFLGIFGVLIFLFSFRKLTLTGAVIGTSNQASFTIFTVLGLLLIGVFLLIEKQESKIK